MKKFSIVGFLVLSFCCGIFAQNLNSKGKADFNGKWILDKDASFVSYRVYPNRENLILTISQNSEELKIAPNPVNSDSVKQFDTVLFLDKRGEENAPFLYGYWDPSIKSKTVLKNNSVIREYSLIQKFSPKVFQVTETYALSKDGNTLTITLQQSRNDLFDSSASSSNDLNPKSLESERIHKLVFHKS